MSYYVDPLALKLILIWYGIMLNFYVNILKKELFDPVHPLCGFTRNQNEIFIKKIDDELGAKYFSYSYVLVNLDLGEVQIELN